MSGNIDRRVLLLGILLLGSCAESSLLMAQSWTLTGVVTDATGSPLAGVDIDLHPALGGLFVPLVGDLTAADGSFSATIAVAIPVGAYNVSFVPPSGYLRGSIPGLVLSGSTDLGVISLEAGWIISGMVTDAAGVGVAGIDIDIDSAGGGGGGGGGSLVLTGDVTGPGGAFALTMPMITGFFDISFDTVPGSHLFAEEIPDVFIAGDTVLPTTLLRTAWTISGQVFDTTGAPIPLIDLNIRDAMGSTIDVVMDDTDLLGQYSVIVPEGVWSVEYRQVIPGLLEYVPVQRDDVGIFADSVLPDVTLRVGAHLTGTLISVAGTPQVDVDLDVVDPLTGDLVHTPGDNTDLFGAFDVLVPAGSWSVEFRPVAGSTVAPIQLLADVAAPPAVSFLGTVVMPTAVSISGLITDALGLPVAAVDLDLVDTASGAPIFTVADDTGADGLFLLRVPAGNYELRARPMFSAGLAPVALPGVLAAASVDVGILVLEPGHALTGKVRAGSGVVVDAEVSLVNVITGAAIYVTGNRTDALGDYALRAVSGDYDVTFAAPAVLALPTVTVPALSLTTDTVLDVNLLPIFVRGNANLSASVNLADVVLMLAGIFGTTLPCPDAADANDDGALDISDPVYLLGYLFSMGPPPPPPFPAEDLDPTPDGLGC